MMQCSLHLKRAGRARAEEDLIRLVRTLTCPPRNPHDEATHTVTGALVTVTVTIRTMNIRVETTVAKTIAVM